MTPEEKELVQLNQKLLDAIATGNWKIYAELCHPSLTAFEPEARGQLVEGLEFHHWYFGAKPVPPRSQNTICSPHVRLMGDTAVVCFGRVVQKPLADGGATSHYEETRVWQKIDGKWRHVHFHRSPSG